MLSTKQRSERLTIWVVLEFPLLHRKDARCDLQVRAVAIFLVNMSKKFNQFSVQMSSNILFLYYETVLFSLLYSSYARGEKL